MSGSVKQMTRGAKKTSILPGLGMKSGAALIASARKSDQEDFLSNLSAGTVRALPYLFEFWALDHQIPPAEDWRTWVVLGGRGAGKTRAGAEWVRSMVEGSTSTDAGRAKKVALVGETVDQVRDVMIFGESGILACTPEDRRPQWIAGRRMLVWPNGAEAQTFSACDPESLRGPQFDGVWADELGKWTKAEEAWDMLQFSLRLGTDPKSCVTTTPRNSPTLRGLLARKGTVMTHATTQDNAANLADSFLDEVEQRYAGTRLGRQELDGLMLSDVDDTLWPVSLLGSAIIDTSPKLDRVVVAVDPPITSHAKSDECGIIVAGVAMSGPVSTWTAVVLEDASVQSAAPLEWVRAAIDAMERHSGDRLVVEVNQGGDLIEQILRQEAPNVPLKAVRATKGKGLRAEPVAALYEQGRVKHLPGLGKLEDQLGLMTVKGFKGQGSPDRVDALVWALHDLILARATNSAPPRMRLL